MSLAKFPTRRLVLTRVSIHVGGLAGGPGPCPGSFGTNPSRLTPGTNPFGSVALQSGHVLKPTKLERLFLFFSHNLILNHLCLMKRSCHGHNLFIRGLKLVLTHEGLHDDFHFYYMYQHNLDNFQTSFLIRKQLDELVHHVEHSEMKNDIQSHDTEDSKLEGVHKDTHPHDGSHSCKKLIDHVNGEIGFVEIDNPPVPEQVNQTHEHKIWITRENKINPCDTEIQHTNNSYSPCEPVQPLGVLYVLRIQEHQSITKVDLPLG